MSIVFDYYETPSSPGEDGKKHYHVRPLRSETVNTRSVINKIHERSSLSKGDILSTLEGLGSVLSEYLQDGKRVHLDRIGYFSVTLRCAAGITTPKGALIDKVGVKSIKYRADKQLRYELLTVNTHHVRMGMHSAKLSEEEIDKMLYSWFAEHQVMTRKQFQSLCRMSQITAIRYIRRLVEEGKLKNIGRQRQPIYVLNEEKEEGK